MKIVSKLSLLLTETRQLLKALVSTTRQLAISMERILKRGSMKSDKLRVRIFIGVSSLNVMLSQDKQELDSDRKDH